MPAVCFRLAAGGGLVTTLLQPTAAIMLRHMPAIMARLIVVIMVVAVSWLRWQVAAAVQHQHMWRAMVLMERAAAPIPAVIPVDRRDVRQDRVLVLNLLVH